MLVRVARARSLSLACALAIGSQAGPVAAHEYWLDPEASELSLGDTLRADVRNGEAFVGNRFPFDPARFTRAELVGARGALPVGGRLGDVPALVTPVPVPGLFWLALETTVRSVSYDDEAEFQRFVAFHGLDTAVADARARAGAAADTAESTPEADGSVVRERYSRHALTAVRVRAPDDPPGTAAALPAAPALEYALVPTTDPFVGGDVTLVATFDGEPAADVQVEQFVRAPGEIAERRIGRTDASGRITFPLLADGEHLFNSVRLRPASDPAADWRTWWASLTIERRR